eukprot:scaffold795_cov375-Prasinococcus_capsulatus_cf.AAC.33
MTTLGSGTSAARKQRVSASREGLKTRQDALPKPPAPRIAVAHCGPSRALSAAKQARAAAVTARGQRGGAANCTGLEIGPGPVTTCRLRLLTDAAKRAGHGRGPTAAGRWRCGRRGARQRPAAEAHLVPRPGSPPRLRVELGRRPRSEPPRPALPTNLCAPAQGLGAVSPPGLPLDAPRAPCRRLGLVPSRPGGRGRPGRTLASVGPRRGQSGHGSPPLAGRARPPRATRAPGPRPPGPTRRARRRRWPLVTRAGAAQQISTAGWAQRPGASTAAGWAAQPADGARPAALSAGGQAGRLPTGHVPAPAARGVTDARPGAQGGAQRAANWRLWMVLRQEAQIRTPDAYQMFLFLPVPHQIFCNTLLPSRLLAPRRRAWTGPRPAPPTPPAARGSTCRATARGEGGAGASLRSPRLPAECSPAVPLRERVWVRARLRGG